MDDLNRVVDQLREVVAAVSNDRNVQDDDLRTILAFLVKVAQVVEQSLQNVYTLAVQLSYLSPDNPEELYQLRQEVDLLTARSHYRDSLEICSRLKHLTGQFEAQVRPALTELSTPVAWRELFWLIEEREGRIISLLKQAAYDMSSALDRAGQDLSGVTRVAREYTRELRPLLSKLQELTSQILGLSGRPGFLELTRDRDALRQAASIVIHQGDVRMTGDIYNTEKAGAVGPYATAHHTTFIENYGAPLQGVDLATLAAQLGLLKQAMKADAQDTSHFEAVAAVSAAEDAAKKNDGPATIAKLKVAGKWAFETATKIGVSVAAEALKKAIGLG